MSEGFENKLNMTSSAACTLTNDSSPMKLNDLQILHLNKWYIFACFKQ